MPKISKKRKVRNFDDSSLSSYATDAEYEYDQKTDDGYNSHWDEKFRIIEKINMKPEELVSIKVGDLNKKLKNVSPDVARKIKQLRRTIKNRGYAAICRGKRQEQMSTLEIEKMELLQEIGSLKNEHTRQIRTSEELKLKINSMRKILSSDNLTVRKSLQIISSNELN